MFILGDSGDEASVEVANYNNLLFILQAQTVG